MARVISVWVLFVLLAALYVYMVVAAVGNLLLLPDMAAQIGLSVNGVGWFWLWLGVLLPVTAFVLAALVGRRRKSTSRLLILALGLAMAAAVQLEILHLVPQSSFFA
jgi:hypothetical protein